MSVEKTDPHALPPPQSWSAVEAGPIEGFSPLHVAAYYGKAGALRLLMARAEAALTRAAANVAAASLEDDASARRASFWAQRTARSPTALDALALGELPGVPEADGPLKYRYHVGQGASFLHLACYSGSAECVRLLLEHAETDVNAQTDNVRSSKALARTILCPTRSVPRRTATARAELSAER